MTIGLGVIWSHLRSIPDARCIPSRMAHRIALCANYVFATLQLLIQLLNAHDKLLSDWNRNNIMFIVCAFLQSFDETTTIYSISVPVITIQYIILLYLSCRRSDPIYWHRRWSEHCTFRSHYGESIKWNHVVTKWLAVFKFFENRVCLCHSFSTPCTFLCANGRTTCQSTYEYITFFLLCVFFLYLRERN